MGEKILKFIIEYYAETTFYPNYREISESINKCSLSTINYYMKKLEDKGVIVRKTTDSPIYRVSGIENYMKEREKC